MLAFRSALLGTPPNEMRRLNHALLLLGLGFLVYLVCNAGPHELWHQFGALGWGVLPLILSEGLANLAHTLGWRHCLRGHGLPLLRLFRFAMAGYAINYFTPSASVGGEVSKVALLSTTHRGADALSSVLLDKLMTGIGHLILAVLGSLLLLWRVSLPRELWIAMAVTTGLLTGGMAAFLLLQQRGKLGWICQQLVQRHLGGRPLLRIAEHITEVDAALKHFYRERPRDLVLAVCWHLLGHSMAILQVWVYLCILKQPAPLTTVAAAGFLSLCFDLLTFAVPLNLGTLEGSRVMVFRALGCPGLLGMAFGLTIRAAQMFWACFGLVSYSLSQLAASGLASRAGLRTPSSPRLAPGE